tara:strand:+ start:606 stop:1601 length:996 start_codon:yes stop_codon:yes gene_type:complete
MFVQGFGEVLTDIMTVNPALSDLPSASAILDTSNYTFQAVTFGKDADGFIQHSHAISSIQYVDGNSASGASSFDNGILNIINYGSAATSGASSYVVSATYNQFYSIYNSVPNDPSPLDTRLERGSTLSTNLSGHQYASALPNLGHYANPVLNSQLSSIWNKVGGFAPSDGGEYHFYDKNKVFSFSGTLSGQFNTEGLMDKNGYLTVSPSSVDDSANYDQGAFVASTVDFSPSAGSLMVKTRAKTADALSLVSFGSVKHLGIYCLDLRGMLASGLMPPYNWNALNNSRKYKLVAKSTILDNPLFHRDLNTVSGFKSVLAVVSVIFNLTLDFK